MKTVLVLASVLVLISLVLSACGTPATPVSTDIPTEVPAPTEPAAPAWTAPAGALVALPVDAAPALDGVADESSWADAVAIVVPVAGGSNNFATDVTLKAVYSGDNVYFLVMYADPTESWYRSPWQKQEDGTWAKRVDPNDKGGDNNLYYEDKLAFIWPINESIQNFQTAGCFVACHAGENTDLKPYGNKYTANEGELGDIWHWKSVRNLNQIDDQYLDWTRFDPENANEAGRKSDSKESGGYADNYATMPDPNDASKTIPDKSKPGFSSPNADVTTGAPGYILDGEKVPFDDAQFESGDYIPGIVKSEIVGDRGDITAGWTWENGVWTIEFGRKLVTGSEFDVQFGDLTATYYFGLAVFENAQVRHAYESGASSLVFQPD